MIKHKDSEQVILSALLMDYHHSMSKIDGLTVEKFTTKTHRCLFGSMVGMAEDRLPIDAISVSKDSGVPLSEVSEILDKHVSFEHISHHCEIVVNAWKLNEMVAVMHKGSIQTDDQSDPSEIADRITAKLQEIDAETATNEESLADIFDKMMVGVLDRFDKKIPSGLKTGYSFIDSFTNGYKPGNLIVIGARPGVGKTTFALNQAIRMAKEPIGFLSLEMNDEEMLVKTLGVVGGLDTFKIESGNMNNAELSKLSETRPMIEKLPLIIKDPMTEDPNKIINQIKALHSKYKIKACFVDYLQLMSSAKREENRNNELGKITRKLKRTAQDLRIPIIVMSQLNRPPNPYTKNLKNEDDFVPPPRPTLTALRDSGAIEQDANVVIFLHNKEPDDVVNPYVEIIIAKNRGGQLGAQNMIFKKKESKFVEEDIFHE